MDLQNTLKNSYIEWLKEKITTKNLNDAIEITSPLMDRHNDHLQIYAIPSGDTIKLTDDGYIISDLLMSGCDISTSKRRKEILNTILNSYGVQVSNDDELFVETTLEKFPQKKHMLLQAMINVNDMFMTTKETVQSIFIEDVENFFINNDIRYTENISFAGKSGFTHKFDFVIPRSKQSPERIVRTINNPNKSTVANLLFSWSDTREMRRQDTTLYTFLNNSDKKISDEVLSAFTKYDVKTVLWSEREKYITQLIA
jgi:hypothetical protein